MCTYVAVSSTSTEPDQSDEPYGSWSVTDLNPGDCYLYDHVGHAN